MTDRNVIDLSPAAGKRQEAQPCTFSAFSDHANLVLLGDPGAGKTHLFLEAAEACGGEYLKARSFLLKPAFPAGSTLFIDALDEKRAGRGDQDTIDAIVQRLFAVAPAKVRISCRAQDWLWDTDLAAFRTYFTGRGGVSVLALQALSPLEQQGVLLAQGATEAQATAFLDEAEQRGLSEFTLNPQNLIMLWNAVKADGVWPTTRRELFELSSRLLLSEVNPDRMRVGTGVYSPNELRDAAGALCAVRLISDVEGVSLQEHSEAPDFPSYRSLSFVKPELAQAVLMRRAFVAGAGPETVDYAHRTTAEFLGAGWIAKQVDNGLPVGRVRALVGVAGHPASELRGLHAWLPVFLPGSASLFIDADPYGVLTYGDAASLTPSARKHLLDALGRLSESDPGFRDGHWESPAIGMLAQLDMVDAFRTVLGSATANFGLRSIVMEALAAGTPIPALLPDLSAILPREPLSFAERLRAMEALFRLGEPGKTALIAFYKATPSGTADSLRLRAQILAELYGTPFSAVDVAALLQEATACGEELVGGVLWRVHDGVPLADVSKILDAIQPPSDAQKIAAQTSETGRRNLSEVASAIERLLLRHLKEAATSALGKDVRRWLQLRSKFRGDYAGAYGKEIADALREQPALLRAIAGAHFEALADGETQDERYYRLYSVTLHTISGEELSRWIIDYLPRATPGTDKERMLFEMALSRCWTDAPWAASRFEELSAIAKARPDLAPIFERAISVPIPSWQWDQNLRQAAKALKEQKQLAKTIANFTADLPAIRKGQHIGWLAWAAQICFGEFIGVDTTLAPRERLAKTVGEANAAAAMEGFIAWLDRPDLPSPAEVTALAVTQKRHNWWLGLVIGMDEAWELSGEIAPFKDDVLRAVLAVSLLSPMHQQAGNVIHRRKHSWREAIYRERPDLARDVYVIVARAYFGTAHLRVEGLHELLKEEALAPYRDDVVLAFLDAFPNAQPYPLADMLDHALVSTTRRGEFLDLARRILGATPGPEPDQRDRWLVAAYLMAPREFQHELETRAAASLKIIWTLRDMAGYTQSNSARIALSIPQLEFCARLAASHFPAASHPQGGWSGDRNAWDASDFVRRLYYEISAVPTEAAGQALKRLEADARLRSYQDGIRHAVAAQHTRRRDAEFHQPNWKQAAAALANKAPANVADLCALVAAQLYDLNTHIVSGNADIYKQFWNVDSFGRITTPRPEDTCRDALPWVEIWRKASISRRLALIGRGGHSRFASDPALAQLYPQ
jgi:hypothetical protein